MTNSRIRKGFAPLEIDNSDGINKTKMKIHKQRKFLTGFTLIELLVVIAIIGVLASVVLASLNTARRKARDVRRVADIKQLQLALEMEFDDARQYPAALATLVTNEFISVVPQDPLSAAATCRPAYCYAMEASTFYHLGANLEDTANAVLNTDKDCSSAGLTCPAGVIYNDGGTGFDGAAAGIYDVVP